MRNLERRLHDWVQQGLLDQSQSERIRLYEEAQGRANWALYSIAGVGVIALMAGIISVVAANWMYFSSIHKLGGYFILQTGLAVLFLYFRPEKSLIRELALTLNSLFVLAGIALIGQIFHLQSDGWSGLLMWIALTAPALWLAQSQLINHLWLCGFAGTVSMWVLEHDQLIQQYWGAVYYGALTLLYFLFGLSIGKQRFFLPVQFCRSLRQWSMIIMVCFFSWIANGMWAYGNGPLWKPSPYMNESAMVALVSLAFALAGVMWAKPALSTKLRTALHLLCIVSFFSVFLPPYFHPDNQDILGCFWFIAIWSSAAAAAAFSGRRGLFNLSTFVIAARFVVVYFELFGSLAATGVGLILSGLVIIGMALGWNHYRKKLSLLVVERVQ